MVGEIRDLETAQIAVQASLTGHLVLSTLHTNSAVAAVTRLRDMGVESFLLASSVIGVLSQRLVRLLCSDCKAAYEPNAVERAQLGLGDQPVTLYRPAGCSACDQLGYRGRTGIFEMLDVDEGLRGLIHDDASEQALTAHVRARFHGLHQDGLRRVLRGDTSLEEVLRVTREE
jgi:general secretion pathway protein E